MATSHERLADYETQIRREFDHPDEGTVERCQQALRELLALVAQDPSVTNDVRRALARLEKAGTLNFSIVHAIRTTRERLDDVVRLQLAAQESGLPAFPEERRIQLACRYELARETEGSLLSAENQQRLRVAKSEGLLSLAGVLFNEIFQMLRNENLRSRLDAIQDRKSIV